MEHLHPDDALTQLQNIYQAISEHGIYICVTPNRLSGPHDISKYFSEFSQGFHLKEYTVTELYHLFKAAGFSTVFLYRSYRLFRTQIPLNKFTLSIITVIERGLMALPYKTRRSLAGSPFLFRDMTIIGYK